LKQRKGRGSLTKLPGRTGTHAPRPSDLDLRVLVGSIQDLILAVAYGSGGQDRLGARAAALVAGALLLRRRCAEEGDLGNIGLGLRRGLVLEHHRGTCIPRAGSGKRCRAGNRDFGWCGGATAEVLAGARASGGSGARIRERKSHGASARQGQPFAGLVRG